MTKSNLKKRMASMVTKVTSKQSQNDFNQACVMFIYQPNTSTDFYGNQQQVSPYHITLSE